MDNDDPPVSPVTPAPAESPARLIGVALAGGLVIGVALAILTLLLSRSSIGGDGWSLSGNGALIVPFLGLPVVLVGGTVFLATGPGRGHPWWRTVLASLALLLGLVVGLYAASLLIGV